jgi:hypothetical protein
LSWRELAPEPSRFWIRHVPKRWPAPAEPYLDLADRRIVWPAPGGELALPRPPGEPPGVVYVPPVPRERREERDRWVKEVERAGQVALVQIALDESVPSGAGVRVLDLFAPLIRGGPRQVEDVALPIAVAFPLLPGVSAGPAAWAPWLAALAAAGARTVVGVAVDLTPADRRRLADLAGEDRWQEIFHGDAPSERAFAGAASASGLRPLLDRPEVVLPPRAARNRELATLLAQAGDLCLRLGRGEAEGQSLLAAARHVEATPLDVAALAREGNLSVLTWLSPTARGLVEAQVATGGSALVEELRGAWLAPDATPDPDQNPGTETEP